MAYSDNVTNKTCIVCSEVVPDYVEKKCILAQGDGSCGSCEYLSGNECETKGVYVNVPVCETDRQ